MRGPAKNGVIVYSRNIKVLSKFYIDMFNMILQKETDEFICVNNEGINLVIHIPPIQIPEKNFNTVKMFLTVESHEKARSRVVELGGEALDGLWSNSLFKVCNIADPEGNHIQIREFML